MVSIQDVYGAFVGSFPLNVRLMNEICQVRTVEIEPKPGTPLYLPFAPGSTCRIPLDYVIAPPVIVNHAWDFETIKISRGIIAERFQEAVLVDVGANTGMFSRQMLTASPEFRQAFAYEPHPENFRCLQHNIAPLERVQTFNYALGPEAGVLNFYIDPDNCGNYSLNPAAMPQNRDCASMPIAVKSAAAEAETWLATGLPIFYKSDTQGHDEVIATSFDSSLWDKVFAGIFELWRIKKPSWSAEKMSAILDRFPHKRFLGAPHGPVSTDGILTYLSGEDGASSDILFWK
jgi:FkbM family methyltransferase